MRFYVIMRRETGSYVAKDNSVGAVDTDFIALAKQYNTRKQAIDAMGPNTCVCGPYPKDDYEGKPA